MRQNNTQEVFTATASTYDQSRTQLMPAFETFYNWVLDLIPSGCSTLVDLGAGSGILTRLLRSRFPEARIHLVDFSAPMLSLARERLGPDCGLVYHSADYLTGNLPEAGSLCAIVSALSIHHLEDPGKRRLFDKVYAALRPGGVFVNADHIAGPTPELEARYRSVWLAQVRANGATEQQIADSIFRQQEDRRTSVETQLTWMRAAGFADADCWYKNSCFAVLAGTRD